MAISAAFEFSTNGGQAKGRAERAIAYWVGELGWAEREQLVFAITGKRLGELPKGRCYSVEKALRRMVEKGKLRTRKRRDPREKIVYYLPRYKQDRDGNLEHALKTGWFRLYFHHALLALGREGQWLRSGAFLNLTVRPDFAVKVPLRTVDGERSHLYCIEYQGKKAAETTLEKISAYIQYRQALSEAFDCNFLWVVFALEKDEAWVEAFCRRLDGEGGDMFFFGSASTLLGCPPDRWLLEPIFFWSGAAGKWSLLAT